ncbi:hypothetical protein GCM10023082_24050 [Streptomyces tremellae]|uniref:Uncharacterized protein n=1 Tax=Streptomyces tremellae TaxID=1124239 RepID=A0ABP7EVI1_9ACTN
MRAAAGAGPAGPPGEATALPTTSAARAAVTTASVLVPRVFLMLRPIGRDLTWHCLPRVDVP